MPPRATVEQAHFSRELFSYLKDLKTHNNKQWFTKNKERYETVLKAPALQFIRDFEKPLERLSPNFLAVPKASGGSLFRIYRDTRFSKDKTPYKTQVGIHFRHFDTANNPHAPGWYLHIEPGASFCGVGIWHGDGPTLQRIRAAIDAEPAAWKRAKKGLTIEGDSLKRAPKGYDPEHPLVEDLKRKDFVTSTRFSDAQVTSPGFLKDYEKSCRGFRPFMRFLTQAQGLPF